MSFDRHTKIAFLGMGLMEAVWPPAYFKQVSKSLYGTVPAVPAMPSLIWGDRLSTTEILLNIL